MSRRIFTGDSAVAMEEPENGMAGASALSALLLLCLGALPLVFAYRFRPGHDPIADPAGEQQLIVLFLQLTVILASGLLGTSIRKWRVSPLILLALVPIAVQAGHTLLNPQPTSLASLIRWIVVLGFAMAVHAGIAGGRLRLSSKTAALAIAAAALGYIALFGAIYADPTEREMLGRATLGFGNIRYTGYFIAPAAAILLACGAVSDGSSRYRLAAIAGAALLCAFTFYTGTRASLFSILAAMVAASVFLPLRRSTLLLICTVLSLLIGYAIAQFLPSPPDGHYAIGARMSGKAISELDSGRLDIWIALLQHWREAPLFGLGEIDIAPLIGRPFGQAHNSLVQVLVSWGIAGSVAVWTLVALLFWKMRSALRMNATKSAPAVAGIACFFAHSLVDGPLFYAYPLALCAMLIAAFTAEQVRATVPVADQARPIE